MTIDISTCFYKDLGSELETQLLYFVRWAYIRGLICRRKFFLVFRGLLFWGLILEVIIFGGGGLFMRFYGTFGTYVIMKLK